MANRGASKSPRKRVKRLPKLKGRNLIEVTVRSAKKRAAEGKKLIPKKELEIAEEQDYSMETSSKKISSVPPSNPTKPNFRPDQTN